MAGGARFPRRHKRHRHLSTGGGGTRPEAALCASGGAFSGAGHTSPITPLFDHKVMCARSSLSDHQVVYIWIMKVRSALATARSGLLVAMLTALVGSAQPLGCRLQIGDPDVFRVAQLQGSLQQTALQGLLANRRDLSEALFYYGNRLRPSLRGLLQDGEVGESAAWSLALIGVPEDVKTIIGSPPRTKKLAFASRWAYGVATSLLEPTSDSEWAFLQKCALNEFDDRWVDGGAIQTLKLIGSPRSREILEGAQRVNAYRVRSLTRALEYVDSGPVPLFGSGPPISRRVCCENSRCWRVERQ